MNHDHLITELRKELTALQAKVNQEIPALKSKLRKLGGKCQGLQRRVAFLEEQLQPAGGGS